MQTRLKAMLQTRLMEAGWHDEMADYCRGARWLSLSARDPRDACVFPWTCSLTCRALAEVIRNKSLEHLDIGELVKEIAPRSRLFWRCRARPASRPARC